MTFTAPWILLWLPACLLLAWLAVWAVQAAGRRRELLLGPQAARLAPRFSVARRLVRDGLSVLAVALCLAALAGPQFGSFLREVQQRGVDVVIVLDTSRSMLARDVPPSRLERARREIRGLLDRMHGDRIGLVTFAGDARVICPLTADPTTFRLFLDDVDTSSSPTGGTAIGEGLEKALDSFDPEVTGARVIVLLSDGEDHDSDPPPSEVAYRAKVAGIPVHVVAFGAPGGAEIPIQGESGSMDVVRDKDGQPVISEPDENLLAGIANVAGGSFLSAEGTSFPLDEIWNKRISQMDGVTRDSSTRREGVNRFQWLLVLVLALLAARELVSEGRARRRSRELLGEARSPGRDAPGRDAPVRDVPRAAPPRESAGRDAPSRAPVKALSLLLLLLLAPAAAADEDRGEALLREALAALAKNDPATALEKAKEARPDLPGSPVLANIVADAERLLGNYDEALAAYASGAQGEYSHRAHFNAAVAGHERAEQGLAAAGVPLDPAGLPEGPQPDMLKAITENLPSEWRSREDFLRALDDQPSDAAARESVAALNRRLDDLDAMQKELQKRADEEKKQQDKDKQDKKDDDKDKDKQDQKDKQDKDKQDQKDKDKQDKDKQDEQKKQDDKDKQEGKDKQDDKPSQDGKPDQKPGDPQQGDPQEGKLGKEQIQQLMDQLADLEKEGRQLQKAREIARRQAVEKDW